MQRSTLLALVFLVAAQAAPLAAQQQDSTPLRPRGPRGWNGPMDSLRIRQLYVSKDTADLAGCGGSCDRQIEEKRVTDSIFTARSKGVLEFRKVSYKSRADGLTIPAMLFAPLDRSGAPHAALVWIHGGVHGNMDEMYWPFIREAVERGYVVITPDYRGSTGYGNDFYRMVDYGGYEVDDALSAVDFLATLPYVDSQRLGVMGWSHGGFITSHILFRGDNPFRAGAAIVPVTNLIFRLSDHGPGYQRSYAGQTRIQGLPFEEIEEYMRRSPVFHADSLKVPILVHVATNDCDVFFRENQQMVYTLRALKPDLAETKIYVNPPPGRSGCGHTFSRRVDSETLERMDSPEQIDSWNRVWTFFQWNLRPMSEVRVDHGEWLRARPVQ